MFAGLTPCWARRFTLHAQHVHMNLPGDVEAHTRRTPSSQAGGGPGKWNAALEGAPAMRPGLGQGSGRPSAGSRAEGGCGKEPVNSRHLPGSTAGCRRLELPGRVPGRAQAAVVQGAGRGRTRGRERDGAPGRLRNPLLWASDCVLSGGRSWLSQNRVPTGGGDGQWQVSVFCGSGFVSV